MVLPNHLLTSSWDDPPSIFPVAKYLGPQIWKTDMIFLVGTLLLPILCDPFGMVKWKAKWPPNRGWKGHFESPGCCFFPTKRFLLIKYFGLDNNRYLTTRWLNQPFCKICESQIGNLPQIVMPHKGKHIIEGSLNRNFRQYGELKSRWKDKQ